jgi:hypothetical protein
MQYLYTTALSDEPGMETAMRNLLDIKDIEAMSSPYINPVLSIRKSDEVRPVWVARDLNKRIPTEYERLMPADQILQRFVGTKYFLSTDYSAEFFQILLKPVSRKYSAFMYKGLTNTLCFVMVYPTALQVFHVA